MGQKPTCSGDSDHHDGDQELGPLLEEYRKGVRRALLRKEMLEDVFLLMKILQQGGTSNVAGKSKDAGRRRSSGGQELHPTQRPRDSEARQGNWGISWGEIRVLAASSSSFSLRPR